MAPWLAVPLRSLALFLVILVFIRLMGKRQLARMTPFGLVTYLVIALMTALTVLGVIDNFLFGLLALGVWVLLSIVLDLLSVKSKILHDLVKGRETILVKQGKVMEENLQRVGLTGEELLRELRCKNVFYLGDVEFAVLETTGDLSVLLKADRKPVTPHDLGKEVAPQAEPQTVILDGNMLDEPLADRGLNRAWLKTQLERMGISLDNVYLGQVDSTGELYLDLFDDAVHLPQPKVKEMLHANLEKVQADLANYALETKDDGARSMYSVNAGKLEAILHKLEPYLLH